MFTRWWTEDSYRRERIKRLKRRTATVMALALVLAATAGCSLLPKEEEEEVLPVITPPTISKKPEYTVRSETLETAVSAVGSLKSRREEPVYFTSEGLHIKEINIKPGDKVAAGAVIASLDVEDLQKQLRKKKLEFRKQEVAMKETLRKRDEMDPIEFEEASIVFEEARTELSDLEAEIAKGVLTAPFSGTVLSVSAAKGDTVKAYEPVAVIADTSDLVVAASFAKEDLEKVAVGMKASVDINAAGVFEGKVKVMPSADSDTSGSNGNGGGGAPGGNGTTPVKDSLDKYLIVQLDKMPSGLNRGTPLSVKIVTERKENAILIPISALRSIGSRTYVQVVEEDGSKREVDVEVGKQTSTDVEILKGLEPGQKVVGR
ncbi:efflux transporter periplasmic adaptor subunit [Paenibacillus yonginensis]|uniref:Efflux transporter periplasmic adaptor subunit n=1 Tax=Paenibacillus yonginensis TaxID=1462996 RepID=A0A1B1N0X1_9BACL|nr:efflux RND transporter periplasmic adaptor subunit [Paenibacillus yonginensis]ANS75084.1 efflux transporter periplasmic adaptor subunit [Paenibacillus yonginensis]